MNYRFCLCKHLMASSQCTNKVLGPSCIIKKTAGYLRILEYRPPPPLYFHVIAHWHIQEGGKYPLHRNECKIVTPFCRVATLKTLDPGAQRFHVLIYIFSFRPILRFLVISRLQNRCSDALFPPPPPFLIFFVANQWNTWYMYYTQLLEQHHISPYTKYGG